jgi:segregation and condensation protein A
MDAVVSFHQKNSYKVFTSVYEGPLDLLLQLIEKSELDITKVAIAQVTDQYLQYLHHLDAYQPEEVSAFLVIATRLIQIKSEALLPRPVIREEGEEDPGEALAHQLMLYRIFRNAAEHFGQLENDGNTCYLRLVPPPKIEANLDLGGMDINDLVTAAREVFTLLNSSPILKDSVTPNHITIRQKINLIKSILKQRGKTTFKSFLVDFHSRIEAVVTFLAILELIKRQIILANQADIFGEIDIELISSINDIEQFDLEFDD